MTNGIWEKIQNGTCVIADVGKNFIQTEEERSVAEYLENAKKLAKAAKDAGADAIKFQTHTVEDEQLNISVTSPHFKGADRYSWVTRNTNATPMDAFWQPLKRYCDYIGALFFSTPMSRASAQKLESLGVEFWKISSGDLLDFVMLDYVASTKKPVIISSGMSTLEEIDRAIAFLQKRDVPLAILHCVSKYPCPPEELNLATIQFLRDRYQIPTGFSDHSIGIDSALAAVALGATIVEKHFTFDRKLWGADHKVSMTPDELAALVSGIRAVERNPAMRDEYLAKEIVQKGMGTPGKTMDPDEAVFRPYFRKSLMIGEDIPAGTQLRPEMIYAMRPQEYAGGLPSEYYESVLGKTTVVALKKYDHIKLDVVQ